MDACDLPQTTAYRKLNLLTEAGLVEEGTELRPDGHHTTRYERMFEGILIGFSETQRIDVQLVRERETAPDRLARLWSEVSDEL